jgi:hypothetical protein
MNSNAEAAGQFPSGPSSENCDKQTAPASGRVGSKALVIGILAINPRKLSLAATALLPPLRPNLGSVTMKGCLNILSDASFGSSDAKLILRMRTPDIRAKNLKPGLRGQDDWDAMAGRFCFHTRVCQTTLSVSLLDSERQ